MSAPYYGDFPASHTAVCMTFDSFALSTGAPSATSNFMAGDIQIYKDGGVTQRSSSSGIVVTTSFDSNTGLQMVTIDLSDNTDAGFYAAGHEYQVAVADVTIDSQTMRFWLGSFSIERALGTLALVKARTPNAAAGASGGLLISGANSGTTTLAALTVTGVTTLTGNVILSDGLTISAPSTANRAGITVTGNGTGSGVSVTSGNGATGDGVTLTANSTNGSGLNLIGKGNKHGLFVTAGATGNGITVFGGATSGAGMYITAVGAGDGISIFGISTSNGVSISGGATGATGDGVAITSNATNGNGISITGSGTGHGIYGASGLGATGDGLHAEAKSTNGNGIIGVKTGTGKAIKGPVDQVTLVDTVTTYTGNTLQTGDTYALANGASGFVATKTDTAAIKAKTDNLPASPAAVGSAMTLTAGERTSVADALLARNIAGGSSSGRLVSHALATLRNKQAIVAGVYTCYAADDTTPLFEANVTTAAGNPLSAWAPTT